MVRPLRDDKVPCQARRSGLFVVGRRNDNDHDVPRLPTISMEAFDEDSLQLVDAKICLGYEIFCPDIFSAFSEGDVVYVDAKRGILRGILSARANANTLLVTEQCENRCTFCSQPPNFLPDTHLYHKALLSLLNFNTEQTVGISGGEPTTNRHGFTTLLRQLDFFQNRTPLHILSHGRNFADQTYCEEIASLTNNRRVLWGIPLYGHTSKLHDILVGADGAFIQTLQGLLNLSAWPQPIELRIVVTAQNYKYVEHIVRFASNSFSNIAAFSIMNLEPIGWARNNWDHLFVSAHCQKESLGRAISAAGSHGIPVSLFNYPLCLLDESIRAYAAKSISDWKNYYPEQCEDCKLKPDCCGFFTSAKGRFIEKVRIVE